MADRADNLGSEACHFLYTVSISPYRSSWSRNRLLNMATRGRTAATTAGTVASSTSNSPTRRSWGRLATGVAAPIQVAIKPRSRLEPERLCSGDIPEDVRMEPGMREVVVLLLVPFTITDP